jgi:hypothetical protein
MHPARSIDDFLFDRVFQPLVNRFPEAGPPGVARFFLTGSFLAAATVRVMRLEFFQLALLGTVSWFLYYTSPHDV